MGAGFKGGALSISAGVICESGWWTLYTKPRALKHSFAKHPKHVISIQIANSSLASLPSTRSQLNVPVIKLSSFLRFCSYEFQILTWRVCPTDPDSVWEDGNSQVYRAYWLLRGPDPLESGNQLSCSLSCGLRIHLAESGLKHKNCSQCECEASVIATSTRAM